ncbi:MAG: glucosamine-6-phosphate deaminase [Candidatus Brocadiia bacterium]
MRVITVDSPEAMGREAGAIVAAGMQATAHYVLGLATGSTPVPLYKELIRLHREEGLDFSTAITFNLDEYIGLAPSHEQSYRYFMDSQLFEQVNIHPKHTHVPDGLAEDIEAHCLAYEMMIDDVGGIDCQVLGIGSNGHIAFNEPGSSLASRTRAVELTESTIQDNSRFFDSIDEVPTRAITMGIGTIMEAERLLMLVSGSNKANALAAALEGPVTARVPASALQMHPDVTCVVTEDAATKLTLRYRS